MITAGNGGGLDKMSSDAVDAMKYAEGCELSMTSAGGKSSLIMLNSKSGKDNIQFEEITNQDEIKTSKDIGRALRSKPFKSRDSISMEVYFNNIGVAPPARNVRILLEEIDEHGSAVNLLGIAREYSGRGRQKHNISFTVPKTFNPLRIKIEPALESDSIYFEVGKWLVVDADSMKLGKKAVENFGALIPLTNALHQNFPNPFNPKTTIAYSLQNPGVVSITVYDLMGKEVSQLINKYQEPGFHAIDFDATRLASGVYVYKLTSGSFSELKKMILIK